MSDGPPGSASAGRPGGPRGRGRFGRLGRGVLAPAFLLSALAVASLVGELPGIRLAAADRTRVTEMRALLGRLPDGARVVVGFDPDAGTYPEIRPAVRQLLRALAARGTPLTLVSLTPEGRALAAAELEALRAEGVEPSVRTTTWISGAEAALVRFVDEVRRDDPAIALVIGGIDIGPRSWVEQVAPRLAGVPIAAVAPTALRPELEPYRASGQLAALVATLPDLTALAATGEGAGAAPDGGGRGGGDRPPAGLAVLLGMLVAIVLLLRVAAGPWLLLPRRRRGSGR